MRGASGRAGSRERERGPRETAALIQGSDKTAQVNAFSRRLRLFCQDSGDLALRSCLASAGTVPSRPPWRPRRRGNPVRCRSLAWPGVAVRQRLQLPCLQGDSAHWRSQSARAACLRLLTYQRGWDLGSAVRTLPFGERKATPI